MHFGQKLRELKHQLGDAHHPKNMGMPRGQTLVETQFLHELVGHFDREGFMLREIAAKVSAMSAPTDISVINTIEKLMVDAARYRWLREEAGYATRGKPAVTTHNCEDDCLLFDDKLDVAIDKELVEAKKE